MTAADPLLQISGLTKTYPGAVTALGGVDLGLHRGEVVALIGPSGAGKSTLIRCVNQLVPPTAGTISLDGQALTGLGSSRLRQARRKIGMIFQEFALVDRLTVMENVLSGRLGSTGFWPSLFRRFPPDVVQDAYRLLDRVGLAGMENKRADALSGGQRQRVGIARALLQKPELLLVDEPTASLDPRTSRQIMRLITEVAREHDLAAIINIHDVRLAQIFCPRIVGLRAGVVVFDGAPADLTPSVLTSIYGEEDWTTPTAEEDTAPDEEGPVDTSSPESLLGLQGTP